MNLSRTELHQYLEEKTQVKVDEFAKEQNITDPKKGKRAYNFFYGSELLKLARLAGSEPLNPHEFNPVFLARLTRGVTGVKESRLVSEMIQNVRMSVEPLRPWDRKRAQEYPPEILSEARKIFEYWKLADKVLNEQPALAIYENQRTVVLATHSGFVGLGENLGDLAYNPLRIDQAIWSRLIHEEKGEKPGDVEKYGPVFSFPSRPNFKENFYAKFCLKIKLLYWWLVIIMVILQNASRWMDEKYFE